MADLQEERLHCVVNEVGGTGIRCDVADAASAQYLVAGANHG